MCAIFTPYRSSIKLHFHSIFIAMEQILLDIAFQTLGIQCLQPYTEYFFTSSYGNITLGIYKLKTQPINRFILEYAHAGIIYIIIISTYSCTLFTKITFEGCNFHIHILQCAELKLMYTCASESIESFKIANK